jgi:predicted enzyme related to lactoylglutathione lyase
MPSQQHHRIDYVELIVSDLAEAMRFYGDAFDWTFTRYGPAYAGINGPADREVGGLEEGTPRPNGGPLVIIYSDDLDATLGAVLAAGGAIHTEPYGFPGGRRFHFTDPSGNELAAWTQSAGSED